MSTKDAKAKAATAAAVERTKAEEAADRAQPGHWFESNPLWFKTAVFYEIHLRGFFDGNDDGSGDFRGLIEKLDYLQWLGIDCIWLLPMYASPLRDGGYDIADYNAIHPDYGTVEDFRAFVEAAHQRGMRVIADLVMNHTSSEHPWFQEARSGKDSPKRDWYVWSDTDERWPEARIIFIDTETSNWTWDSVAEQYYWHRFFSHQPDLNYDNPEVQEAMLDALRFWLDLGIDGFRLDAVPYLYERDGTNGENLAETHEFLQAGPGRGGRELPRPRAARRGEPVAGGRGRVLRRRRRVPHGLPLPGHAAHVHVAPPRGGAADHRDPRPDPGDPGERPVGPVPAQPRRADARDGHRRRAGLHVHGVRQGPADADQPRHPPPPGAAARQRPGRDRADDHDPLLAARVRPVLYYGDEIGMGDNIYLGDRDGVRTPMQWTGDRNGGFSRADFAQLYLPPLMDPVWGFQATNVEAQLRTPTSLLRWLHRFIALRKAHPVFGLGTYEVIRPENTKIFAHIRRWEDDIVLAVHNVARSAQAVELDLSRFAGHVPEEMFGHSRFPAIGELPYLLTLAPRGYFWFLLRPPESE